MLFDKDQTLRDLGLGEQVDLRNNGQCPLCKSVVSIKDFATTSTLEEFNLTGLCLGCQVGVFSDIDIEDNERDFLLELKGLHVEC